MVVAEKKNVPVLRFPECTKEWAVLPLIGLLDEVIDYRGLAPPKKESGVTLITAKNIRQGYLDFRVHEYIGDDDYDDWMTRGIPQPGDVLFTTEAPLGNVCMYPDSGKFALGQRTITLRARDKVNFGFFIFYLMQTPKSQSEILKRSTGTTAKGIKSSVLKLINFSVPDFVEQQKITVFISSVDDKINVLRRKHELLQTHKRGLMQKVFSQELRFTNDDGTAFPDWEDKKLSDLADRQTAKNIGDSISRVLTNSARQGVLDQRDYFYKDIANKNNLHGYYIVEKNDYVYNPRISVHAPVGPINKNRVGQGLMSPLYSIFRFKDKINDFYEYFFQTRLWHRYMCSVANYGARHDRMNITTSDFLDMPLPSPHIDEQIKIVRCLNAFDKKIDAVTRQLAEIEAFKKGLLQKMFV